MISGSLVAIVTPFKNGAVDEGKLVELVERQIREGTRGIVPCGTTGESATLSREEHEKVIRITVETVNGRVPVLAGTGSNSTDEALLMTKYAKEIGADASLLITPYYNKPTQDGLFKHFELIAKKVDIPIVLYNVPGRTGVNLLPETAAYLSQIDNIIAIKEASGSLDQVSQIIGSSDLMVISGDDSLTLPMLALGAKGVISVVANIVPGRLAAMLSAWENGNIERARAIHLELFDLMKGMFIETNPIPVKEALKLMGLLNGEFRLPLCRMTEANLEKLKSLLGKYNLLTECSGKCGGVS
ncbi:MAG: 4-hydroxy-tetrahydrodipicolinate synthase [Candidatus Theseobacter exili]|nr:4-hydroxy-tetrahydrodipicolinate synthase [Candidatus Theseobacter exili]